MNARERLNALIAGTPVDRLLCIPITMMFAADAIGRKYGDYAMDHRVLAEGQLAVAGRFGVDHVSTISDPAREAADCGAALEYFDDQPPAIDENNALLLDKATLLSLKRPNPLGGGRMHDRIRGIELLKSKVGDDRLVEGWVEGPCAQGSDLRGINNLMLDFLDDEAFVEDLFSFIVEMEIEFAHRQIDAGASHIGIGDAAASLVGPGIYERFVFPAEKRIVDAIQSRGIPVRLHICGNTLAIAGKMAELGCGLVDLDNPPGLAAQRAAMGPGQVIGCNIDPVRILRAGTPESIRAAVEKSHAEAGGRFYVCAGCEVPRDTKAENFAALCEYGK